MSCHWADICWHLQIKKALYISFKTNHKSYFTPAKDDHKQTTQVCLSANIYERQKQKQQHLKMH